MKMSTSDPFSISIGTNENQQSPEDIRRRRLKLHRASLNGDWREAKSIYDVYKDETGAAITRRGDTALHVAASAKRIDFVKELLKLMNAEDLGQQNMKGHTAFIFAAASGMVELAREMMKHNNAIAIVRDCDSKLPIHVAASLGHKHMVEFLYAVTKDSLSDEDSSKLLIMLIETELYDVALMLLLDRPKLATYHAGDDETALQALARKKLAPSYFANRHQRGFFSRCFNLGAIYVGNEWTEALELVERIWKKVVLLSDPEITNLIEKPQLIFEAAKHGNFDFLKILIREDPDLVWQVDDNNHSIFHIAVMNRQWNIFMLIYKIGSIKDLIVLLQDKQGNNILHLAGMLAQQDRLNIVPGAAFQMQLELSWFKEVKKVVPPRFAEAKNKKGNKEEGNNEGLTPRALFSKTHKDLMIEGEKWMKDTASSCMIVATLIATVVFAAAFTVPGGIKDDGFPFFLDKVSFKIFAISNAISMVSSSISIVLFLSILTSRYAEEDYLESLPRKLLYGLTTLLISIAAMMVVFSSSYFLVFNGGRLWIAIMVTLITSIPVILYICQPMYQILFSRHVIS